MTTYKFCVAPGGALVCYKINNGFVKFSGNYAYQLLEHIKDFSFYTFNSYIKKGKKDKYTYDMIFDSNNHRVVFEDINNIKKNENISIESEIKDLVDIINDNNVKEKKSNYKQILRKIKSLLCAATITSSIMISDATLKEVKAQAVVDTQGIETEEAQSCKIVSLPAGDNIEPSSIIVKEYDGPVLTKKGGVIHNGPAGGDETYYDLNMNKVVKVMRDKGFDEANFPYWVRDDGVKMLGNFVMVAANLEVHPRGTIVQTSLGVGLVCDTGEFAKTNRLKLDIATSWTKGR